VKCEQIDRWLDAMMDGEISAEDMRRVEEHCETCAECAEKLKLNRQMMGMFAEMAPEMDVPLTAQAAWRSAVRAEAGKARRARLYRFAGGIAAALVVAIGATFALRTPPKDMASNSVASTAMPQPTAELMMAGEAEYADEAPMMAAEYAAAGEALIEADGAVMMMDASRKSSAMHEVEMVVEDLDRACEYVSDLVEEYEGTADEQRFESDGVPCANLYIELPAGNAGEFMRAAAHYDKSGADVSGLSFGGDGDVSLLLVLRSE
jgi:predicted anti-sigma-YlaC factor YlaD